MECEHKYQYQGTVYRHGSGMAGSSARERIYSDKYFCEKCLDVVYKNERVHGDSYQKPFENTLPL